MVAKTGVARLALEPNIPVVPIAHWGAQRILPYGKFVPKFLPRKTVQVVAGPPVDLSEFAGQPLTNQVLRAATDKIMADVAALLGGLRGLTPPAEPFHPAVARRKLRQDLRALAQRPSDAADSSRECRRQRTRRREPPARRPQTASHRPDRQLTTAQPGSRRSAARESRRAGRRGLGHHVRPGALRRRDAGDCSGAAGPSWPTVINASHASPDYLPGISLPATLRATADPAEALAGPSWWCWQSRPRRCGRT